MGREFVFQKTCKQDWDGMAGTQGVRYCAECQLTVHNLSALTRRQAENLVSSGQSKVCGRLIMDERGQPVFRSSPDFKLLHKMVQISALSAAGIGAAMAQTETRTCQLRLTASDIKGARVTNVKVKFSQPTSATGWNEEITADPDGMVTTALAPGKYRLQVVSPGFKAGNEEIETRCENEAVQQLNVTLMIHDMIGEVVFVNPNPSWFFRLINSTPAYRLLHPRTWFY